MSNYFLKKREAIYKIHDSAKKYDRYLKDKNLLIIYGALNRPSYIEATAGKENFLHLTGVKLNAANCSSAIEFYRRAIENELNERDFEFKGVNTINKLLVLSSTLTISQNATMIGDYNENGVNLYTNKLAGSTKSCLGFIKTENMYVPNTVLKTDIRNITSPTYKVLAILSKSESDKEYEKILKVGNDVNVERLLNTFNSLYPHIHISNALLGRNSDSPKHTSHEEQTVDSDDDTLDLTGGFTNLRR